MKKWTPEKQLCVKRLDCVLTICYQTILGSIVNIHNRAKRARWPLNEHEILHFDNE
jgi:hypothetical protein